jgi:hypothetical protein
MIRMATILLGVIAVVVCVGAFVAAGRAHDEDNVYVLKERPEGAADVVALRENAGDQADVLVVGRIGGKVDPWVRGVGAFLLVDRSLPACNEISGDSCPTPWDYCCEPNLSKSMVLVTFVDEAGRPIRKSARELLPVKELDTVIIEGKAKRDEAGNVSVQASRIFVEPEQGTTQ